MSGKQEQSRRVSYTTVDADLPPRSSSTTSGGVDATSERRLALATGEVIRGTPYRLVRWLGDGGMGSVFEAEHVDTERRVAVKLLHAQRRSLGWVTEGFRNEARVSARIDSPHIVDVFDFKELDDGRLLIAMEFLDGPTLQEELREGPLEWPRIIAISRQICQGLAAAHREGIVHRDVKPENIMLVRRERRSDFVKLLDFGVAHFSREDGKARMSGTAQYMAPEVLAGASDARVDVYAMGCLLYALIVGEPPFDGETASGTLTMQQDEEPVLPSRRLGRWVPPGLEEATLRCLAKSPDDRMQTMEELEVALCEAQLEHGWRTPWDDLPLPRVDEVRRAELEAGFARLGRAPRSRGAVWGLALGIATAAVAAVGFAVWPEAEVAQSDSELESYVLAAQRAAARFYFVYPPPDDPRGATAYRTVLELEALPDAEAEARGEALRREFAQTLVRLGDRYWDYPGARPFAYEYYASALVFADHDRARERAAITPAGVERLRHRAAEGDFGEHELLAVEALAALAAPDAEIRARELASLRDEGRVPASVLASIDRVLEHQEHVGRSTRRGVSSTDLDEARAVTGSETGEASGTTGGSSSGTLEGESTGEAVVPQPDVADEEPSATDAEPSRPRRDRQRARTLVADARAADAAGDRGQAEALFNRALEADPRCLDALDGLADIAFRRARYGESARTLERAVTLGPQDAGRWLRLGDSYFKTLRYSDARRAYERSRELGHSSAQGRLDKLDRKVGASDE